MIKKAKTWEEDQKRVEGIIGQMLRTGVVLAALIVLTGGILYLTHHGFTAVSFHQFRGEPVELRSFMGICRDAFTFHSLGLIQLGILVLIATPISRVIFSVFAFAEERDWMYVGITLVVLSLLLYSLLGRH